MKKKKYHLLVLITIGATIGCGFGNTNEASSASSIDNNKSYINTEKTSKDTEVKIGGQIWMKSNLNVDEFSNGEPIPEAKNESEWKEYANAKKAAFCYYDFDKINGDKYGKLYNCYALIDSRGLAPNG